MNIDTCKTTTTQTIISPPSTPPATTKTKHSHLYTILNPKSHTHQARLFQTSIASIIIIDALIYIISTEPKFQHLHHFFYTIEGITSTLELIARLVVCTEKTCYKKYGPIKGRWRYMYSFQGLIDSLATLPFFVELITGIDLPTLTYLRVFRLIRITRTRSYTGS
jgi:voltage-gated potassium channel